MEHALLVPLPEVAEVVEPWLEHSIGARPSHGIPPHVTLLAPSPADVEGIAEVLAGESAFDVRLRDVRRFDGVAVYLGPEPADRFVELTRALWQRFPDWPPYEGKFLPDITPHLTVAWGSMLDEAEEALADAVPLRARAREAVLFRQAASEAWEPVARFPFREP